MMKERIHNDEGRGHPELTVVALWEKVSQQPKHFLTFTSTRDQEKGDLYFDQNPIYSLSCHFGYLEIF